MSLAVARIPANGTPAQRIGSLIMNPGGPGGSGIDSAKGSRLPLFMAMREFGDVIAFDQRGTGMSGFEELDCDVCQGS